MAPPLLLAQLLEARSQVPCLEEVLDREGSEAAEEHLEPSRVREPRKPTQLSEPRAVHQEPFSPMALEGPKVRAPSLRLP